MSLALGAMGFSIWGTLLAADSQYVLQGDSSHPAVRVWPGFLSERSILINEKVIVCQCSVLESPRGAGFVVAKKADTDVVDVVIKVAARTTTAAVRTFLAHLLHSIAGDGADAELEDFSR